jgi:hypothetical protein
MFLYDKRCFFAAEILVMSHRFDISNISVGVNHCLKSSALPSNDLLIDNSVCL